MRQKTIYNISVLLIIVTLSILLSYAFESFEFRLETIILIYIAAVLLIMVETKSMIYGVIGIFTLVFSFNFLFITPRYTFIIEDPNNIIMLIIFTFVALVLNMLTNKMQKEAVKAKKSEERVKELYANSKNLLNMNTRISIIESELKYLYEAIKHPISFYFKVDKKYEVYQHPKDFYDVKDYQSILDYAIDYDIICGQSENKYADIPLVIFPFKKKHGILGATVVSVAEDHLNHYEKDFIQTNMAHILMALERELIEREKETSTIEIERERLKSAILRSISHDLRTPLTSLQTGVSFVLDSYDDIDDAAKKNILKDIHNETTMLSEFVENLLNMTRMNAGKMELIKKSELIDDILSDLYTKTYRRLGTKTLNITFQKEMHKVYADPLLLLQVLVNLVDNAIRHTNEQTVISVSYEKQDHGMLIEVSDNGGGISHKVIDKLFTDFTSYSEIKQDKVRGMGLGLSISRTIIEAHKGSLNAKNNDNGGATFSVYLPDKE